MDIYNKIEKSLLGLNSTDTKFAKELQEVKNIMNSMKVDQKQLKMTQKMKEGNYGK